jgi:hypothetical protein
MEIICPQCSSQLVSGDGQVARCAAHGGSFRILYQRAAPPRPPLPVPAPPFIPPVEPVAEEMPAFTEATEPDGTPSAHEPLRLMRPRLPQPQAPAPVIAPPSPYAAMRCVQHPSVSASAQCNACGGYVCVTCDFALPRGRHLCPTCAVASLTTLSPKRKSALYWSVALAVWCTLGMAALFGGVFARAIQSRGDAMLIGVVMIAMIMLPSIIGFSIGMSAINRRLSNPPLLWVATAWNGLVLGCMALLWILGTMK